MKYTFISILMLVSGLSNVKAQLIPLPDKISRVIAGRLSEEKSIFENKRTKKDTLNQYCFILQLKLKYITSDSVKVLTAVQMEGTKEVKHFSNIEFLKRINFAGFLKNRKINTINIPCFYSIVDRTKQGSERINLYYNFWGKFDDMFVREKVSVNEIFTRPIAIFGAIYE